MGEVIACKKCRQEKVATEFYVDDRYSNGFTPWCKECSKDYTNKWRNTSAGKESCKRTNAKQNRRKEVKKYRLEYKSGRQGKKAQLRSWLKNLYNITLEEYEEMEKNQNSLCAICGQKNKNGNRLGVDHCHQTGKVRGLLCFKCNTALGLLDDNAECVWNMLNYLRGI